MRVRRKYIRSVAERLLDRHAIHVAPIPVDHLAAALGIEVRYTRPGDDTLSGFLVRDDGSGNAVIGVNETHPTNRRRFTIAHEIGHFLLHTGQEIYVGDCAKAGLRISLRNEASATGQERDEIEANVFAVELLLPAALLENDIAACPISNEDDLDKRLDRLAKKYKVSQQVFTYRLVNLGYIHL